MANGQYVEYFYDLLDRPTKVVYYNTDDSVQATYCYVYNAQGQLSRQFAMDNNGNETESYTYEYDSLGRIIQSREDSGDETTLRIQQLYDTANRIKSQYWTVEGDSYSETYTYDTGDGSLESMTTAGGQTLSYTYDALKRHTATTVAKNGSTIFRVAKAYYNHATDSTRTTAQVQYYNVRNSAGTLIAGSQYVYDKLGNIIQIKESESPYRVLVAYEYDALNQLTKETTYTYSGTSTTPSSTTVNTFTYDTAGNLLKVYENGAEKDEYTYEDDDWQDLLTKFNGTTINYDASGNPLNWYNGNTYTGLTWTMGRQLESLTMETDTENISVEYDYDMSGMRSSKTVVYGVGEAHSHEYTSAVTAPTCTTAGYTTYTCDCGESYVDNLVDALGHNYVQSGNVYTCSRCGDSYTGHEHSYTEATTEPTCLTAGYTVYTCSCGDSYTVDIPALGHNYVLVNQTGNVATYECSRCGHRYTAVIPVDPQPPVEYSLRSSNTVTEHHEYVYASGKLMRETITTTANGTSTTEILDFVYGSGSTPLALVYTNGTAAPATYYYITNMQGDVVKLVSAGGTVVASYTYDAWGKVLSATSDMAEVNPIRYRGYYYDTETELYYLQSRYYDPVVRRFINADALVSTGQGFTGYDMFAYCMNNPVTFADAIGYAAERTFTCNVADISRARVGSDPPVKVTAGNLPEARKAKGDPEPSQLNSDLGASFFIPAGNNIVGCIYRNTYYVGRREFNSNSTANIMLGVAGFGLSVAAFFVSPVTVAATAVNCSSLALSTGTLASGIASALSPLPKNGSFSCYAVETTWTELTTTPHGDKTNYLYTTYSITTIYVWNDEIDGEEGWAVWYEMGSIVSQRELCY